MPYDGPLDDLRVRCGALTLRPPRAADTHALMDVYDDDFNLDPQPRPKTEPDDSRRGILNRISRNPNARNDSPWGLDLIAESEAGLVIGWASLEPDARQPGHQLESSTWIAPIFRRRGHATTIRHGLLALAFDGLHATQARSRAQPANQGSNNISRRLGYERRELEYTPRGVTYQPWSLAKDQWTRAAWPVEVELSGHGPFSDWVAQGLKGAFDR